MALEATTIAAITAITATAAAGGQAYYTSQASAASRRAERLREQQMRLDAMRRRRESIRQSMIANSVAASRGVAQGVGEGSSVLFGALGQTQGELGRQVSYTNESEAIGAGIFQANRDIASAQAASSMFQQAGNLSTSVLSNSQKISDIGQTLFGPSTGPTFATGPGNPSGVPAGFAPGQVYGTVPYGGM